MQITSTLDVSAPVGVAFSYLITATESPTLFSATGLPDGLTLNAGSGLISGTPTSIEAVVEIIIGAANNTTSASAPLLLRISGTAGSTASGNVTKATLPPLVGSAGDVFVDQFDEDKIYNAFVAFDLTALKASVTVPVTSRPAAALTFSARTAGHFFGSIRIVRSGATGTSAVAVTGTGDRADPYLYTITAYDDNNSNDDLIALLAGDSNIEATGASATDGAVIAVAYIDITNGVGAYWNLRQIRIQYDAEFSGVNGTSDEIPPQLPLPLRNALPEYLAARLGAMLEGGDLNKARLWASSWTYAMEKARAAQHASTYPSGMRPG